MSAAFDIDASTAVLFACQETVNGAPFVDETGNEYQNVSVTSGLLAQQTGPISAIKSRRVDGLTTSKFANGGGLSTVFRDALQNQCTIECVFAVQQLSNAQVSRTLYALGGPSSHYLWLTYNKTTGLFAVDWVGSTGEKSFTFSPRGGALVEGAFYYLALTKTVTSGTTISNRVNTWSCWLLPLSSAWTDAPDNTTAAQTNPNDTAGFVHMFGSFNNGSNLLPGAFDVAGFRGSSVVRSAAELQASFNRAAGIVASTAAVAVASPVASVGPARVADFAVDYGTDVSTFPGLDASFGPLSGAHVVAQAVARRFLTPRKRLLFHQGYGIDLRDYLGETVTAASLFELKAAAEAEAEADERVANAQVYLDWNRSTRRLTLHLLGQTLQGPFSLVLGVDQLSIELLSLEA